MRTNEVFLASRALDGANGHEAGRALLSQLYRDVTGDEMPPVQIGRWGKPYFSDGGWHFSVSHTPRHVFCALCRCPVGLDAEELDRAVPLRHARRMLSAAEYARFQTAPDPRLALLSLWVLKEAAAKLDGRGLRGIPNDTNFDWNDGRVQRRDGCLVAVLTQEENHVV